MGLNRFMGSWMVFGCSVAGTCFVRCEAQTALLGPGRVHSIAASMEQVPTAIIPEARA